MKQEFFEIQHNNDLQRIPIIRQDRIQLDPGECSVQINDKTFDVVNVSAFGIALCIPMSEVRTEISDKQNISNCILKSHNKDLQNLNLKLVRSTEDNILAFESVEEPICVDEIKALRMTQDLLDKQTEYVQVVQKLPKEFVGLVYQMKDYFEKLRTELELVEKSLPHNSATETNRMKNIIIEQVSKTVGELVPGVYQKIPKLLDHCNEEVKILATQFAREHIGPFVYGAPFANRAYHKPRGYAGDYEMMNHLYRNEHVGPSLFDQCMHKYFIDEPAGQAVKNRGHYLFEKLSELLNKQPHNETPLRVLSIASGPAMEVQLLLKNQKNLPHRQIEFHFIDQDEESLKHAQRQIHSLEKNVKSGYKFYFHNLAIKNIIAKGIPFGEFDFVYSAGLFDYFSDPVATSAAQRFFDVLKPNGSVCIGNFSTKNPCIPLMEVFLDWHLIYRTNEDLVRIFSPVSKKIEVEEEPLGINIFAIIKK